MRYVRRLATLLLALVLSFSSLAVNCYAYDLTQYDQTDDGYRMDESHGNDCEVFIFVFVQDNMTYMTNRGTYKFGYYSDDLPSEMNGYAQFYRQFMFQGCDPDEALENGVIYKIRMTLEPGTYCFSYPEGRHNTNIMALTQDFNTPIVGDGYYTAEDVRDENIEKVTLTKGCSIPLFIMFGDDEWRGSNSVQFEFKNWAKAKAASWYPEGVHPEQAYKDSVLVIDDSDQAVEKEAKPTFVPAEGPTRVTSDIVTTEEIPPEEFKVPWFLIGTGVAVVAGIVIYFVIKKKFSDLIDEDD